MKRAIGLLCLNISISMLGSNQLAEAQESREPRIAIGEFEYRGVAHLRDGTRALPDMITTALMQTRRFELVERQRVNEALREMGLGEAGITEGGTAQRLGTLVGADFILLGTITQASLDERDVATAGIRTSVQEMRMGVDIRIIDAKTGQIRTAETVSQSRTRSENVQVQGSVATGGRSTGIVGDVMRDVANEVIRRLVSGIYPIKIDHATGMQPGDQVRLDYGNPVVQQDMIYNVYNEDGFSIGRIQVTEVRARDSIGKIVSGLAGPGMILREAGPVAEQQSAPREIPW